MKKSYKLITTLVFAASASFAQQIIPCYTEQATKYYNLTHPNEVAQAEREMAAAVLTPEYKAQMAQMNARNNGNSSANSTASVYAKDTIPVVFHILHQNGTENVSDAVVRGALAEVNRVHTKTIPDTANIDPYMKPVFGANNYVFVLATKDPQGNCTNGIIRHLDPNTNWDQTQYNNFAYTWPRANYLNVYIVRNICSGQPCPAPPSGGIIVGYTYIGGTLSAGAAAIDAVVYNYAFMTGTNARSMAHEFGHWLSLPHTFGNTNTPGVCLSGGNSDDFLATAAPTVATTGVTDDTPKYAGAFSTCPAGTPNSCDVSNHANVQNIMDYSSCPLNFTNGQIKRMHNLMGSTAANRSTVVSAANKVNTGIRHPQVCIPTPYFHASTRVVCAGAPITFSDSSANAKVTSYNWSFPGGTFVSGYTATDSMPKVTYATPGTYAVSYTASTSAGSATKSNSTYITVLSSVASFNSNFTEGFEGSTTVPGPFWSTTSTQNVNWTITSSAAATGANSVMISNVSNVPGDTTILYSPSFNLAAIGSPALTFKMAYQQQATTNADRMNVYSSTDCGATWSSRWARSGTGLQPTTVTGTSSAPFVPTAAQFALNTVVVSAIASSTNVLFKWVFIAGTASTGNNMYIDDINVRNSTTGIQTIEEKVGLTIYPNPSSGSVNVAFNLAEKQTVAVNVVDMLGRVVETIPAQSYSTGENMVTIGNKAAYQAGVYFVNLTIDGQQVSKKIIIE
ncbi:MAG: M43 family zinc metalloprotease [Bacteroidia bacterium]